MKEKGSDWVEVCTLIWSKSNMELQRNWWNISFRVGVFDYRWPMALVPWRFWELEKFEGLDDLSHPSFFMNWGKLPLGLRKSMESNIEFMTRFHELPRIFLFIPMIHPSIPFPTTHFFPSSEKPHHKWNKNFEKFPLTLNTILNKIMNQLTPCAFSIQIIFFSVRLWLS
jgi:hypothetical protein